MEPYYDHGGITIFHGDCRDVLPMLGEKPALVLADPPYGANEQTRRATNGRGNRTTLPHQSKRRLALLDSRDHSPVIGDCEPFDPGHLLALQAILILWGAQYFADKLPPSRCWFVWDKREGGTPDDNADCELAWTNINAPSRLFSHLWRGVCRSSETGLAPLHPTQKPVALMRWCLTRARLKRGALVLDPYMGSGPIAQACKEMGYRYIGIELVEQYCEIAARRLQQEVMDLETK